jgi:hypothetical protein
MFVRSFVSKKILWNLSVKSIIKCFVLNVPPSNNLECFIVKKKLGSAWRDPRAVREKKKECLTGKSETQGRP